MAHEPSPLTGLRVVDLSTTFMGPYCTTLLAQWGADVVKVEAPEGDVLRYVGDARAPGMGPIFLNANRGKRSVAIDLKDDGARGVLTRLVETADVLVHNLRPRAAARLGITPERMLALNGRLVYCAFRGFGSGGPYENRPAYDDVIQGASGMAAVQAVDGSRPAYWRSAAADKTMGILGAAAVLAAVQGRAVTGRGRAIEVPMFESMASFMLLEQQGGWIFDPPDGPIGYPRTESPYRKPFRTKDGYLAVMVYTDEQWRSFFTAIGEPELADDPRYRTIGTRTENVDELYSLMDEHLTRRTTAEWQEAFERADIPSSKVNTIRDLFEDEHLAATGFFERVDHPSVGRLRMARSPVDMGDRATAAPRLPPRLGEHSVEIAREAGCDDAAIAALLGRGALVTPQGEEGHAPRE
ncbi:CaiB/BaiF CoA transferase family protein [Actinomadura chibensis]|uniref:CaiB/BaiF CoA transferase family protein n=1 Tax=Actinomadura chibensis TaxID=392828 RepID=UPI000833EB19|nr:CoA transferase [Actinomadura chibensis]